MCNNFKRNFLFLFLLFAFKVCIAQTEFPKEFIAHVRLNTGMITGKKPAPDVFAGGLQVVPQVTIIEHTLRGGLVAGGLYANKKINGLLGPTVSLKLAEFKGGYFGSIGNVHLSFDHLWGTDKQRYIGGGFNLDLLNKLILSLTAHRDYNFDNWLIQSAIAFRISKIKQPIETFPH